MFSSLCEYIKQSPYHSGKRKKPVDRLTVHAYVGLVALQRSVDGFYSRPKNKEASCQYTISFDGRVGGVCDEDLRSWCSSSEANDTRAITIECACDSTAPYKFPAATYNKLIDLTVDIMNRYKKKKLVYIADKSAALKYKLASDEMLLTLHKWFKPTKECPGQWFIGKIPEFVDAVNERINGYVEVKLYTKPHPGEGLRAIARRSGITFEQIKLLNPDIKPPMYIVRAGKDVRIK